MALRDAAKRLHVMPVGSLGIFARAYHLGQLSLAEAEQAMLALHDASSLFVTRTIVEMAIKQLSQ